MNVETEREPVETNIAQKYTPTRDDERERENR